VATLTVHDSGVVVVIEDDESIGDLIELYLRREAFRVFQVRRGDQALAAIERHQPRLVVLDIGLPGLDGLEICRTLRTTPATQRLPIILLTARDSEIDRVVGLEMGSDDYLTKPFSPRELVARVKALLRRAEPVIAPNEKPPTLTVGPIDVDLARREARSNGTAVALTTREFDLLAHLVAHRGLALSRQQLLSAVWGADWYGDDRTVDVHVRQLRKKLGDALPLTTIWGVGYRLD
jgi:DNA-binding response OmpR family regulator